MTMFDRDDLHHMNTALALAARGLGRVWPNPAVGCVLVKDGLVVGRGHTQPGGRPHAETMALAMAGDKAKGAITYVSLEPCAHHGKTPPCAEALIKAGVTRVVAAMEDSDPRVSGEGFAMLRAAGIQVDTGLLAEEAAFLNEGFFRRIANNMPLVSVKTATSLDGMIACHNGNSQWITGPAAREDGHLMRARHDAILVGAQTALVDNPSLNVRVPGMKDYSPVRVVADARLQLPLTHQLVKSASDLPTWCVTLEDAPQDRRAALIAAGVKILVVQGDKNSRLDLKAMLEALGNEGITRLMVEGGGRLIAGLLADDLVDRITWYRAAKVLGSDGISAIAGLGLDHPDDARHFVIKGQTRLGPDEKLELIRKPRDIKAQRFV